MRDKLKESHLIGFYRQGNEISPLRSQSPYITDRLLKITYKAIIVPLKKVELSIPWSWADKENAFLPEFTGLQTTTTPESEFYALMYTQTDRPDMCRTGVILKKKNDKYKPITLIINNRPYLIECKGIGSPVGGYPGIHLRGQAGAKGRAHVRLTGGLPYDSAKREHQFLTQHHTHILPYGVAQILTDLDIPASECGLLLRLSPSTIRTSFGKNPDIDRLLADQPHHPAFTMGQEIAKALQSERPYLHRNLNLNNTVYVDKNTASITDWEEGFYLDEGHSALETPYHIFPIGLPVDEFNSCLDDFKKGLAITSTKPPKDINKDCIRSWASQKCLAYRKNTKGDYPKIIFQENINFLKLYMPESYFKTPIHSWIQSIGLPLLKTPPPDRHIYTHLELGKMVPAKTFSQIQLTPSQLNQLKLALKTPLTGFSEASLYDYTINNTSLHPVALFAPYVFFLFFHLENELTLDPHSQKARQLKQQLLTDPFSFHTSLRNNTLVKEFQNI